VFQRLVFRVQFGGTLVDALFQLGVHLAQGALGGVARGDHDAAVQLVLHHLGQVAQHAPLGHAEVARLHVDHAQGADRLPVQAVQRLAGVETHTRFTDDMGKILEPLVEQSVAYNQQIIERDGMAAHRDVAWGFANSDADPRLEPLPVVVDQRHQRDRHAEGGRCEAGETVETLFLRGVEDTQRMQGIEALFFCEFLLAEHERSGPRAAKKTTGWGGAGIRCCVFWRRARADKRF